MTNKEMEDEFRKFFKKYFVVTSQPQYMANNLYTEPTINLLMTFIQSAIHKTEKRMIEEIERYLYEPMEEPNDLSILKADWNKIKLTHSSQKE